MGKTKGRPDPAEASEGGGFDMTSMIDVTFLLIIFFMCVTEMADSSKTKKLVLPEAAKAEIDNEVIPGRLLINIKDDGIVEMNQQEYDDAAMKKTFKLHYEFGKKAGDQFTDKAVLIRADKNVEYGAVQRVMTLLMEAKIWRIAFSTRDPSFDQN